MIRDRLPRDVEPLCRLLATLGHPDPGWTDEQRRDWLDADPGDVVWVFDQAPVSVAPTGNVAGHVRLHHLAATSSGRGLTDRLGLADDDPWLVDQLVVRPGPHDTGFARFLLREAVRHVSAHRGRAVVDVTGSRWPSADLLARRGFVTAPVDDGRYAVGPGER